MLRFYCPVFAGVWLLCATSARGDQGQPAGGSLFADDLCGLPASACEQLAQALVGPNIVVSNVQCRAACNALGRFYGGATVIGFDSGVILGTGSARDVAGPNDIHNTGTGNGFPGDPDLELLVGGARVCNVATGGRTCDATVLEFDFQFTQGCQGVDVVSFEYVFASEEYSEYVDGKYNDVFAFFLNGKNIAIVPGTSSTPVAISTVNCGYFDINCCLESQLRDCPPFGGPNCNLFRNNSFPQLPSEFCQNPGCPADINGPCTDATPIDTEMDGLTFPLIAAGSVNTTGLNHIKLAITDVGDDDFDSNVFLKAGSFQCLEPSGGCCDRTTLTCMDNVQKGDCGGDWLPGLTCDRFNPPCRKQRMLVLLDRTGSMNAIRQEFGNTRCFDALETARQDVEDFFTNNPIGEVAVWTFRRPGPTAHTNGFVDQVAAMAALNSPDVATCIERTPLAESMCAAVDALAAGIPNPFPEELILAVSSDGIENDSDGECFGPWSAAGTECAQYDPGSWQRLVCNKVTNHAVVMARYWGAFNTVAGGGVDSETGSVSSSGVSDYVFFRNLAEVSGGRFAFMDDVAGPPTGACCDPNDRCRDGLTRDACTSPGGAYLGDGTDCSTVVCSPHPMVIPTLSQWGVIAMTFLLLVSGTVILARRRTLPT